MFVTMCKCIKKECFFGCYCMRLGEREHVSVCNNACSGIVTVQEALKNSHKIFQKFKVAIKPSSKEKLFSF